MCVWVGGVTKSWNHTTEQWQTPRCRLLNDPLGDCASSVSCAVLSFLTRCSPLALWRVHKSPPGGRAATSLSGWKCFLPHPPPPYWNCWSYTHLFFFFVFFFSSVKVALASRTTWLFLIFKYLRGCKNGILLFHGVKQALKCCLRCQIGRRQSTPSITAELPEIIGGHVRKASVWTFCKVLMCYYWVCVWFKLNPR